MSACKQDVKLGVIICKRCNEYIDELDTEKVAVFYSECNRAECTSCDTEDSDK